MERSWVLPTCGGVGRRLIDALLPGCAVLAGGLVHAASVLGHRFPLNDGGLFYQMIRELEANGFALPAFTAYNRAGIPYAYPPLGIYLAGLVDLLGRWSAADLLLYLPLAISVGALVAFWRLSRTLLSSRAAAVAAVFAFGLLPRTGRWLLMGGGLTRELGFLFAILALEQGYRLYARGERRRILPLIVLSGCTVLSHLDMAVLLAASLGLLLFAYGRNRAGVVQSAVIVAGTALIAAPWWGTVMAWHGAGPFLAALQARQAAFADLSAWLLVRSTEEPYFPLLALLALGGMGFCLWRRQFLLPAWLVTILLVQPAVAATSATIVEALLVGVVVGEGLLPALRAWGSRLAAAAAQGGLVGAILRDGSAVAVITALLAYALFSAIVAGQRVPELSADERRAMEWIARNTPPASAFAIVTWDDWCSDRTSEWFPALTGRVSVATAQGSEWLPGGAFARQRARHEELQRCANRDASCLEAWARWAGVAFTHVYLPKGRFLASGGDALARLRQSLRTNSSYAVAYDGPGATVFARLAAP